MANVIAMKSTENQIPFLYVNTQICVYASMHWFNCSSRKCACSTCANALVNWVYFVLVTHDDRALNVFGYIRSNDGTRKAPDHIISPKISFFRFSLFIVSFFFLSPFLSLSVYFSVDRVQLDHQQNAKCFESS